MKELLANFAFFDIAAAVVILLLGLRCLLRGFVKEVLSLAGIVGAVVLSRMFHEEAAAVFRPYVDTDLQANVIGYAAIGIGTIVGAALASWIISRIIRRNVLGILDRIGGFIIGALQGVLLAGIILLTTESVTGGLEKSFARDSVLAPHLLGLVKYLSGIVFK